MLTIRGRLWKFGDGIDTDIIIPARYLVQPIGDMKWKAMEPIRPEFAGLVREGDVIIGGRNFGCGSSREQAPAVLGALGIRAFVAISFARIFFRNAINLGIPVIECGDLYERADEGDIVEIDPSSGKMHLIEKGMEFSGSRLPDFLMEIIESGGLISYTVNDEKK